MKKGRELIAYLKSFEGAAATFYQASETWTLWLPEMASGDRPVTPASQLYFAVILRHEQQAFAIRFFYDCSTGKVRYYTSALPGEIATAPEFENAVSELFRHTLPVEPIRQRKLRGEQTIRPKSVTKSDLGDRRRHEALPAISLAEPVESEPVSPALRLREEKVPEIVTARVEPPVHPAPTVPPKPAKVLTVVPATRPEKVEVAESKEALALRPVASPAVAPVVQELATRLVETAPLMTAPQTESADGTVPVRRVQLDVGDRLRSVLMTLVIICGAVAGLGILALAYASVNQDPGIAHHKLQLEALRIQRGGQ